LIRVIVGYRRLVVSGGVADVSAVAEFHLVVLPGASELPACPGLSGVMRPDIETMVPRGMRIYGELCGWALTRAHARSGDRIAIAAYLGGSDGFDQAITRFAAAYADQNERDHKSLVDAVASGRITAERDM
jgi:hypothetical protein